MSDAAGTPVAPPRAGAGERQPVRVSVVGVSLKATCGVRDHATLLADALGRDGVSCSLHWLSREHHGLRDARAEVRAWTQRLTSDLEQQRPDAVLLHYSAFSYSYRGVPV